MRFFKKFQNTAEKAEEGIEKATSTLAKADEALDVINETAIDIRNAVQSAKTLIAISTLGVAIGIVANVITFLINGKTIRFINK